MRMFRFGGAPGLGLTLAVLGRRDTLSRDAWLVPAFMHVPGRWNCWAAQTRWPACTSASASSSQVERALPTRVDRTGLDGGHC